MFEVADRIHAARLGKRVAVLDPRVVRMSDAVAVITGAVEAGELGERGTGPSASAQPSSRAT